MKTKLLFLLTSFGLILPSMTMAEQKTYTATEIALFADENLTQNIGQLQAGAAMLVLQSNQQAQQIELEMWRKSKGFGRVWYNQFTKNIVDAIMTKEYAQSKPQIEVIESKEDPLTGLIWQKIKVKAWIEKTELTQDLSAFWKNAEDIFKTECSECHKRRDTKMHDANEWVAVFNGMVGFTDMDEPTRKQVLRYLQMNASDAQLDKK